MYFSIIKNFYNKLKLRADKPALDRKYHPLTPKTDADEDGVYSEMLNYALSEKTIKNIAVTGPYGAGKSSVLCTFQKNNSNKWTYLNISLATFKDISNKEEEKSTQNRIEFPGDNQASIGKIEIEAIERSILQQLFYSVKQDELPQSRLKRIIEFKSKSIYEGVLFFAIWLCCTSAIFYPDNKVFKLLRSFIEPHSIPQELKYYSLFIFSLFSFVLLAFLFKYAKNIQELKFKFQETEITLSDKSNSSILNKHLDEILYFFERTKFNVVIIEDLDRFNDTEIFIRLRELNTLINSAKQINRHIVFIYAIKDSIFKDKDRTKFFDFIIPIIPIVNPTNAYDLIKQNYNCIDLNDIFLHQVSLYFDDMRLVINIFNEFNLYCKKLQRISLNKNKLLALIIYKNYHPHDFSDLHSNKGIIYKLFNHFKNQAISSQLEILEREIQALNKKLEVSQSETLNSIEELRQLYSYKIYEKLPMQLAPSFYRQNYQSQSPIVVHLMVDNIQIDQNSITTDDSFEKIQQSKNICWKMASYSTPIFTFQDIEQSIDKSKPYKQREEAIKNKQVEKRNSILQKISELIKHKDILKNASLKKLLSEKTNIDLFNSEITTPLLQYLVRHGYIAEDYPDYISYFFESVININEKDFARGVIDSAAPNFETKLSHLDELISRFLTIPQFAEASILNISLMDHVISRRSEYQDQYDNLFKQLSNNSEISIKFIFEFIAKGKHLKEFINQLIQVWDKFWGFMANKNSDEIDQLLKIILPHIELEKLNHFNGNEFLGHHFSNNPDFISFIKLIFTDGIKFIQLLDESVLQQAA